MKKSNKTIFWVVLAAVVIVGALWYANSSGSGETGKYDDFAQCLTDSGAAMYGAYWCPHCQDQKDMFGDSWSKVNYIECDPRGDSAQPQLCEQKGITGYPTWVFGNGERVPGTLPFGSLASKTGCALP